MKIHLSPNRQPRPQGKQPDLIVVHATAGHFDSDIRTLCDPAPRRRPDGKVHLEDRVSSHYLIGKTGQVVKLVEEDQEAWHAGISAWEGFPSLYSSLNWRSIGIELENLNNGADPYPEPQRAALVNLLRDICRRRGIPADRRHIISHKEITYEGQGTGKQRYRKTDPQGLDLDAMVRRAVMQDEFAGRYLCVTAAAIHQGPATSFPIAGHLSDGEELIVDVLKDEPECETVGGDRRWAHLADERGFVALAHLRPVDLPDHHGLTFVAPPRITREIFAYVLTQAQSPATASAEVLYNVFVAEEIDPAVALAFFYHESVCGTVGICKEYATMNWGNCRTSHRAALASATVATPLGPFARYPSWENSARDWCARIKERYIGQRGLATIELALPLYAPRSDGNHPTTYAATIRRLVVKWRGLEVYDVVQTVNIRQAPRTRFPDGSPVPIVAQLHQGDTIVVDLVKQGCDCETIAGEGRWVHLADKRGFVWRGNLRPK